MTARTSASPRPDMQDDRIFPLTRWVSAAIVPFLILAFIILYLYPDESGRRFAWEIKPRLTAMYIGAGYLGGAYLFLHAIFGRRWHRVAAGFPAVTTFTVSMLLITLLHWGRFDLHHFPFQLWLALYVITPLLVPAIWLYNKRTDPGTGEEDDAIVPPLARYALGSLGGAILAYAIFAFILPNLIRSMWPWPLTIVTGRAMAGWFALLGIGGLVISQDVRWSAWKVGLESIALWHILVLLAAALNPGDFTGGHFFNWYFWSVVVVLLGMAILYVAMCYRTKSS